MSHISSPKYAAFFLLKYSYLCVYEKAEKVLISNVSAFCTLYFSANQTADLSDRSYFFLSTFGFFCFLSNDGTIDVIAYFQNAGDGYKPNFLRAIANKKHQKNMSNYTYMTPEGYNKLKAELEHLKTKGRAEAAAAIAEARDKGDLSENAEYDAAKNAQGYLEAKINDLEKSMSNARVLDASQLDNSEVRVLSTVTIKNKKVKREVTYKLVSEAEANLKEKKISVDSPMGKGLLGKKVGETALVQTPAGQMEFEVVKIEII